MNCKKRCPVAEPDNPLFAAIRAFADRRNLSIAALARNAGVNRSAIMNLNNPNRRNSKLRVDLAIALAQAHGSTVEVLCGIAPDPLDFEDENNKLDEAPNDDWDDVKAAQLMVQLLRKISQQQTEQTQTLKHIQAALERPTSGDEVLTLKRQSRK